MSPRFVAIVKRLQRDLFGDRLIQINLRGIFVEYMVAEALGHNRRVVSQAWNVWDLEIGDPKCDFPDRIRIQVKNTAATQIWHEPTGKLTDCQWSLKMRNRPDSFVRDNPNVPCEGYGFLCDVFILCHHPIRDWKLSDHRDLSQWDFYVVPVAGSLALYSVNVPKEMASKTRSYTAVSESLCKGIRGRRGIAPFKFEGLTEDFLRSQLGLSL